MQWRKVDIFFMLIIGKAFEISYFTTRMTGNFFYLLKCEFHHETHIEFINLFLSLSL